MRDRGSVLRWIKRHASAADGRPITRAIFGLPQVVGLQAQVSHHGQLSLIQINRDSRNLRQHLTASRRLKMYEHILVAVDGSDT
jgi:hypothetical protein